MASVSGLLWTETPKSWKTTTSVLSVTLLIYNLDILILMLQLYPGLEVFFVEFILCQVFTRVTRVKIEITVNC